MLIEWTEKYETGFGDIDKQHKEIIQQLNRLHDAIVAGLAKEVVSDIVNFAGDYATKHFAYEESCMDKYQCPFAKQNKEAHEQFVRRFGEIQKQLADANADTSKVLEVYRELRDWIHSHILKIDTNLRACAKAK